MLCNKVFRKRFLRPSSPSKNSSYFSEAICFTPFPRPIFLRAGNQYFCQNNSRRWHFAISGRTEVVGANFCWFFHGESSARAECGSVAGNEGSGRRKYKYKYIYKYTFKIKYKYKSITISCRFFPGRVISSGRMWQPGRKWRFRSPQVQIQIQIQIHFQIEIQI